MESFINYLLSHKVVYNTYLINVLKITELIVYINESGYYINQILDLVKEDSSLHAQRCYTKNYFYPKNIIFEKLENKTIDLKKIISVMMKIRQISYVQALQKIVIQLNKDSSGKFKIVHQDYLAEQDLKKHKLLRISIHNELQYLPPYKKLSNYKGLGLLNDGGVYYLDAREHFKLNISS